MQNLSKLMIVVFFSITMSSFSVNTLHAQNDDIYDVGTVWSLTTIRIDANMEEEYLGRLNKTWKTMMDKAVSQGLIKSYKVLSGNAANENDYNLLLMVENENMASFDPDPARKAKWDAIQEEVRSSLGDEFDASVKRYGQIRDLFGTKTMREIYLK